MKTSLPIAGLMTCMSLICSCDSSIEPLSIERSWFEARYGVQERDSVTVETGPKSIVTCLVSYPDSYDWRKDELCGEVKCSLLIYRDSTLVRSIPAGAGTEISPEADTHFLFGQDIYTLWTGNGSIVIKKNGKDVIRYASNEVIRGIKPFGGALWALGMDKDGIRLRKDGKVVFERQNATVSDSMGENGTDVSGALYVDNGELCFSYRKDSGWHIVRGGEDSAIDARGAIDSIMKVRLSGGQLYVLGDRNGAPGPYLFNGKETRKILYYTLDPQSYQRLFEDNGKIYFAGCITSPLSGDVTTEVWNISTRSFAVRSEQCYIYSIAAGEGYVALSCTGAAYSPVIDKCIYIRSPLGGVVTFDKDCFFSGSRGAVCSDAEMAVGLSPRDGCPFVWKDGTVLSFPVHGYVSTVGFFKETD